MYGALTLLNVYRHTFTFIMAGGIGAPPPPSALFFVFVVTGFFVQTLLVFSLFLCFSVLVIRRLCAFVSRYLSASLLRCPDVSASVSLCLSFLVAASSPSSSSHLFICRCLNLSVSRCLGISMLGRLLTSVCARLCLCSMFLCLGASVLF